VPPRRASPRHGAREENGFLVTQNCRVFEPPKTPKKLKFIDHLQHYIAAA
jgi:hypothetical protein